ncbi:MAG: hypothetical protein KHY83_09225 [Coriobacteriia bacterium]|nr:hypothetical protein [Coriobacteriia bacterium]
MVLRSFRVPETTNTPSMRRGRRDVVPWLAPALLAVIFGLACALSPAWAAEYEPGGGTTAGGTPPVGPTVSNSPDLTSAVDFAQPNHEDVAVELPVTAPLVAPEVPDDLDVVATDAAQDSLDAVAAPGVLAGSSQDALASAAFDEASDALDAAALPGTSAGSTQEDPDGFDVSASSGSADAPVAAVPGPTQEAPDAPDTSASFGSTNASVAASPGPTQEVPEAPAPVAPYAYADHVSLYLLATLSGRDMEPGELSFTMTGRPSTGDPASGDATSKLSASDAHFANTSAGGERLFGLLEDLSFTSADAGKTFVFDLRQDIPADATNPSVDAALPQFAGMTYGQIAAQVGSVGSLESVIAGQPSDAELALLMDGWQLDGVSYPSFAVSYAIDVLAGDDGALATQTWITRVSVSPDDGAVPSVSARPSPVLDGGNADVKFPSVYVDPSTEPDPDPALDYGEEGAARMGIALDGRPMAAGEFSFTLVPVGDLGNEDTSGASYEQAAAKLSGLTTHFTSGAAQEAGAIDYQALLANASFEPEEVNLIYRFFLMQDIPAEATNPLLAEDPDFADVAGKTYGELGAFSWQADPMWGDLDGEFSHADRAKLHAGWQLDGISYDATRYELYAFVLQGANGAVEVDYMALGFVNRIDAQSGEVVEDVSMLLFSSREGSHAPENALVFRNAYVGEAPAADTVLGDVLPLTVGVSLKGSAIQQGQFGSTLVPRESLPGDEGADAAAKLTEADAHPVSGVSDGLATMPLLAGFAAGPQDVGGSYVYTLVQDVPGDATNPAMSQRFPQFSGLTYGELSEIIASGGDVQERMDATNALAMDGWRANGVTYDTRRSSVVVNVGEDDPTQLSVLVTTYGYAPDADGTWGVAREERSFSTADGAPEEPVLTFENRYVAAFTDVTAPIVVAKNVLTGRDQATGEFSYGITTSDETPGSVEPWASATNAADGTVTFTPLDPALDSAWLSFMAAIGGPVNEFTTAEGLRGWRVGFTAYQAAEVPEGVTAEVDAVDFTISFVDNGDGTLVPSIDYPVGGIVFKNAYAGAPVDPDPDEPARPDDGKKPTVDRKPASQIPKTGDASVPAAAWLGLALGGATCAAAGVALVARGARRRSGRS